MAGNYEITLVGYFVKDNGYDSMWLLPPDIQLVGYTYMYASLDIF